MMLDRGENRDSGGRGAEDQLKTVSRQVEAMSEESMFDFQTAGLISFNLIFINPFDKE